MQIYQRRDRETNNRFLHFCDTFPHFSIHEEFKALKLSDLRIIATLGVGGFGRVELVNIFFTLWKSSPCRSLDLGFFYNFKFKNIFSGDDCWRC